MVEKDISNLGRGDLRGKYSLYELTLPIYNYDYKLVAGPFS